MDAAEFKAWLKRHQALHPRGDWPEAAEFYRAWLDAFRARGVTAAEADDASRWLAEQGGSFPDGHLGRLLGRVECRRRDREAEQSARRHAAERAAVAAEAEREREQRERWRSLPRAERRRIVAEVKAANPALARWKLWIVRLAIARAAEMEVAGAIGGADARGAGR